MQLKIGELVIYLLLGVYHLDKGQNIQGNFLTCENLVLCTRRLNAKPSYLNQNMKLHINDAFWSNKIIIREDFHLFKFDSLPSSVPECMG